LGMPAALKKVRHREGRSWAVISLCQRLSTSVAHFLSTVRGCGCATGLRLTGVTCCKSGWGASVKKIYAWVGGGRLGNGLLLLLNAEIIKVNLVTLSVVLDWQILCMLRGYGWPRPSRTCKPTINRLGA
jgi:hypothetical protein